MVSLEQFSSKIMLIRIQLDLPKTSYAIISLFHGLPTPQLVLYRACVGLAEMPDAAMLLCT